MKNQLKVLILGAYPLKERGGGAMKHTGHLADYLVASGDNEVHVITLGGR